MFDIKEELKKLPSKPGVYIMRDENDVIIYVGKAINLKNRVRQYFQNSSNKSVKVASMVKNIAEFEYIVTENEMEALNLECNLIKEYSPKYNIRLKDDKSYPSVKVTLNEDFPRVFTTRNIVKDGAKYYGPFTDAYALKETIETVNKMWPLRKCKKVLPRDMGKERPCLNYHIGQCCAPCDGLVSKEEYRKIVDEAVDFIEGRHDKILSKLKKNMEDAAENLEFETAAALRDKIKAIEAISVRQRVTNTNVANCDVIAFVRAFDEALVQVFFVREGKITGREHFMLNGVEELTRSGVITEFVKQFYSGTAFIPKEILLSEPLEEEEDGVIEAWLSSMRQSKVSILVPQKGEKKDLVDMAYKNASITFEQFGEKIKRDEMRTVGASKEIQNILGLEKIPERIEAYDISNIQGFYSVGAMVVFENGRAKKSDYRKFKIKSVVGANDFASMQEVLRRRINHGLLEKDGEEGLSGKGFSKLPDLIMMDGGKPQITAALSVLADFGLNIPVCGMFKDDNHRTKGLLYNDVEYYMPQNSEGFKLVTRI
ncbi:MAG: excinuclease ABC subunit UvrC, partial [Firmicutes bacterium]|nr:excinuclease ABC subunit UvrC [Bacillota bacterium]